MKKLLILVFCVVITNTWIAKGAQVAKQGPVLQASSGWTIEANPESGILKLSHENLGVVLKEIKLNVKNKQGLVTFKSWTAEKKGEKQN